MSRQPLNDRLRDNGRWGRDHDHPVRIVSQVTESARSVPGCNEGLIAIDVPQMNIGSLPHQGLTDGCPNKADTNDKDRSG